MENKAFTLIELLVVVSIIVLITALTLPNYRLGDNQLAIQRSSHKVSLTPIAPDNSLNVFFAPPNPTISFLPNAATATINIKVAASQKNIQVNKAGLINVE